MIQYQFICGWSVIYIKSQTIHKFSKYSEQTAQSLTYFILLIALISFGKMATIILKIIKRIC